MVLSSLTVDNPAMLGMFADEPAIRSTISWDAAGRMSQCLSWMIRKSTWLCHGKKSQPKYLNRPGTNELYLIIMNAWINYI
jgi:hypothetical protein